MRLKTLIVIFTILILPELASADVIFPLTFVTLPFFPLILLIEVVVFAAYYNFVLKNKGLKLPFGDLLLGIFAANLASSFTGLAFPISKDTVVLVLSTYLASVFVEFLVYTVFFKIGKMELLKISFLTNLASYSTIFTFLLLMK